MVSKDTQITFSAEKQFIHGDSFNKGFVQVPRMVAKCVGLSAEAKAVYNCLSAYVYEHGRSAFPSTSRLAIESNLTRRSVGKYLAELCELGFIRKQRRGRGKTNDYSLTDLHEVPLLHVSEMLWKALHGAVGSHKDNTWEMAEEALKSISDALTAKGFYFSQLETSDEVREALESEILSIMKGGKPMLPYIPKRPNQVRTAEVGQASNAREDDFESRHESEWKVSNFVTYFYRKYRKKYGTDHEQVKTVHAGINTRLLKQLDGDKSLYRKYIDAFFEIGYENSTLEWFGTSGRFAEIDLFIKEGKKPFYLTEKKAAAQKTQAVQEAKQERKGMTLEDFDRLIGGSK